MPTKYPKDFDAVILSGTSIDFTYATTAVASFSFEIANQDPSGRFAGIPNGYLTQATPQSIQYPFYRYPFFDTQVFNYQVGNKSTNTFGELLTLGNIVAPSPLFTGPVDVVNGENDFVFCGGKCALPTDKTAAVIPFFYPAAAKGSQSYSVPNTGHSINAHTAAPKAFDQMLGFLKTNNIV
ncbi:hypothetical protein MMC14_006038 [Varicellaria rhodocarpa]|nr:hypothetical protein [Varicellaria rhodocarpa]